MIRKSLAALCFCFAAASSAAAIEQTPLLHATPPATAHPLPQGTPFVRVRGDEKPIVAMRYAEIDGVRVLVDAETLEVIYELRP